MGWLSNPFRPNSLPDLALCPTSHSHRLGVSFLSYPCLCPQNNQNLKLQFWIEIREWRVVALYVSTWNLVMFSSLLKHVYLCVCVMSYGCDLLASKYSFPLFSAAIIKEKGNRMHCPAWVVFFLFKSITNPIMKPFYNRYLIKSSTLISLSDSKPRIS